MPLLGHAAVAMWWDIAPDVREEFQDWHSHEHFPERLAIPGFRRGSRWADAAGGPGFFVLYELETYETLTSRAYRARLDAPTPWSTKLMPHHLGMVRSQCRVAKSAGSGRGSVVLTLRLSPEPGRRDALLAGLEDRLDPLPGQPGMVGAHLLRTETPPAPPTREQRIRGGDAEADWIVLVEGYDESALHALRRDALSDAALVDAGAASVVAGLYRLALGMTPDDRAP